VVAPGIYYITILFVAHRGLSAIAAPAVPIEPKLLIDLKTFKV